MAKNFRPQVEWNGRIYKLRSAKTSIPDLASMERIAVLMWLNANTYPRGYSKPNPLAGFEGALSVVSI